MRILFLLKERYCYGEHSRLTNTAGLFNSASYVVDALKRRGFDAHIHHCHDGNSVDRMLHIHKPDICVLEALWVTPKKLKELVRLHKKVQFIIRIHSKTPFLANEGIAMQFIKGYDEIPQRVLVSFNNIETTIEFSHILENESLFLPNMYDECRPKAVSAYSNNSILLSLQRRLFSTYGKHIHIGCFGAIRPMKNQLQQAVIAIAFAEKHKVNISFHINAERVERGDNVLKNLRSLFEGTRHKLVEHEWLERKDFFKLIEKMDICMQVSLSESFNIVTADSITCAVPTVVSDEVDWMPSFTWIYPCDLDEAVYKIKDALERREFYLKKSLHALSDYNEMSINQWLHIIHRFEQNHHGHHHGL